MPGIGEAGKRGDSVRSDCHVRVELKDEGGVNLELTSKVEAMYGDKIKTHLLKGLKALGIENCRLFVEDYGALDFVLAARLECAAKRAGSAKEKQFLPEMNPANLKATAKERLRRSRLYLPGNEPKFYINAALHKPDGIILDLEDSVSPKEKDAARILVRNALRAVDFGDSERMVRINQGALSVEDLEAVIPHNVHLVLIPKVETGEHVRSVDARVEKIRKEKNLENHVYLMPIIESSLGCFEASYIASSSPNIVAITIGLEDYTADIGAERTEEGKESFWARSVVVNAARAAGVTPIDSVYSDVQNTEGLRQSCLEAKGMGFEGKGCIHPRQIAVVHEAFAPTEKELKRAKQIAASFEDAERKGLGVVALGSKMIDPPVVKRALKTIKTAEILGLLDQNWKEEEKNDEE